MTEEDGPGAGERDADEPTGTPDPSAETASGGPRHRPASDAVRGRIRSPRDHPGPWIAAVVLGVAFAAVVWEFVGMLTVGVFVYYVTRPVFRRLKGRVGSRLLAVVLTLLIGALPVLVIVGWTLFLAYQELAGLLGGQLGEQFDAFVGQYLDGDLSALPELQAVLQRVLEDPGQLAQIEFGAVLAGAWEWLSTILGAVVVIGLNLFVILVVAFYLLKDDYRIADWARGTVVARGGVVEDFFVQVDYDLEKVFFGNILNALVTGLIAVVVFVLLDVVAPDAVAIPEPILLGLLVGVASLVPLIGIKLVTVPMMAYLYGTVLLVEPEALWFPVAFTLLSFVVVDYIPDQLLRPYVSGRNLHVGAIILAYTFGPLLFGWYGIFLGPLLLVVGFEFARIVLPWLLGGEPPDLDGGIVPPAPAAENAAPEDADAASAGDPSESAPGQEPTDDAGDGGPATAEGRTSDDDRSADHGGSNRDGH